MDHGKLTDHNGKQIDFRNVILIMTTNAGAADMARATPSASRSGKRVGEDTEAINKHVHARNSAIVWTPPSSFGHLPPEVIAKVVDKFIMQLEAQLADRNVTIELTDEARQLAGRERLRRARWAHRPMSRVIQTDDQDAARRRGACSAG